MDPRLDRHLQSIRTVEAEHLDAIREVRRAVWRDTTLLDLSRAVLGFTDVEQLRHYDELALAVSGHVGEPLIAVNKVEAERDRVVSATGGVITGEMRVAYAFFDAEREPGFGSGSCKLEVPIVMPVIAYAPVEGAVSISRNGGDSRLCISRLTYLESNNHSLNPAEDYSIDEKNLLIGREQIFDNPLFGDCIRKLVVAIEATKS